MGLGSNSSKGFQTGDDGIGMYHREGAQLGMMAVGIQMSKRNLAKYDGTGMYQPEGIPVGEDRPSSLKRFQAVDNGGWGTTVLKESR